ncbi:hypothetical protein D3C80_1523780 [compost metagenome]
MPSMLPFRVALVTRNSRWAFFWIAIDSLLDSCTLSMVLPTLSDRSATAVEMPLVALAMVADMLAMLSVKLSPIWSMVLPRSCLRLPSTSATPSLKPLMTDRNSPAD